MLKFNSGFTLIELMVSVAVAAVLLGIAVPNFSSIIVSNRLTTYANDLVTALNLARSEAIKRGVQITVSRKGDNSGQWESGWDVYADLNSNLVFDDDGDTALCETGEDCLLRTYEALPDGYTLRTGGSSYQDYAAFLPSGLSAMVIGDTYRLCYGTDNTTSKAIIINAIGRGRVSTGTNSCP